MLRMTRSKGPPRVTGGSPTAAEEANGARTAVTASALDGAADRLVGAPLETEGAY